MEHARPQTSRLLRWCAFALSGMAVLYPLRGWGASDADLKAAVIYNMLQYVTWNDEAQRPAGSPLVLCASETGLLWPALLGLQDRTVRNLRLQISPSNPELEPLSCDILVLGPATAAGEQTDAGQRPGILVIRDGGPLPYDGTMIALNMRDGRIVFDANHAAAKRSGLYLSSKLLRLARSVSE